MRMAREPHASRFRFRAHAVVVAVSLLVIGGVLAVLLLLSTIHRSNLDISEERLIRLTAVLEQNLETVLSAADSAMIGVARSIEVSGCIDECLNTLLNQYQRGNPVLRTIIVAGVDGFVTSEARLNTPAVGANVLDRDYFQVHLREDRGVFVDQPVRSRLNNEWSIPLSRAVRDSDGSLIAVIGASLEPRFFDQLIESWFLNGEDRVELVDQVVIASSAGVVVAEYPFSDETLGRTLGHLSEDGRLLEIGAFETSYSTRRPTRSGSIITRHDVTALADFRVYVVGWPSIEIREFYEVAALAVALVLVFLAACIILANATIRRGHDLAATAEQREVLIRELAHRTKNSLNVVQSILEIERDHHEGNQSVEKVVDNASGRIGAMSLVHRMLSQSNDLSSVNMSTYLHELTDLALAASSRTSDDTAIAVQVEELDLLIDLAIPIGLIVNELVANALKHAFTDGTPATIHVGLRHATGELLVLTVSDNGKGFPPGLDPFSVGSIGMMTVVSIARHQLAGEITFKNSGGTHCSVTLSEHRFQRRV